MMYLPPKDGQPDLVKLFVEMFGLVMPEKIAEEVVRAGHWPALGLFDLKEHFNSIGLALLPAYWVCWRQPRADEPARTRAAVTSVLAFIVWWSFLIGHVVNNIRGFGS